MKRSRVLLLIALLGVAAASTVYASASGQCTQPPAGDGKEKNAKEAAGAALMLMATSSR